MRKAFYILLCALFFTIGINATILLNKFNYFTVNQEIGLSINPFELITLVINVCLALYVTNVLAKNQDTSRTHRDISINYLQEYRIKLTDSVADILQSSDFTTPSVIGKLSNLRRKWMATEQVLKAAELGISNAQLLEIRKDIRDIWQTITRTPPTTAITIVDIELHRVQTTRDAESFLQAAEVKIFKLIFLVNKNS